MAPASDEPRSSAVPAHPLDRLVSLGLLAFGLWNVISAVATYLNPSPLMAQMMQMLGISGEFTNDAMAKTWGIAAGAVLIIGWILTAAWTVLRLRRGKIAWWVPLVGGVVFVALASVLLVVPFYSDPAVISYIDQQVRNPT